MVRIDKHPYTIVGITPEGFYGTEKFGQTDIFVPMANEASLDGVNWLESRSHKNLFSIVRIKDGVTMPQVQAELNTITARIARQHSSWLVLVWSVTLSAGRRAVFWLE